MYIIIGASSFIGVYTADEFLKQGCKVIVTGRKNKFKEHYDKLGVRYINLDLTNESDFEQLPKEGVEGVILLSGLLHLFTSRHSLLQPVLIFSVSRLSEKSNMYFNFLTVFPSLRSRQKRGCLKSPKENVGAAISRPVEKNKHQ